ncbi:MAG: ThuA domain-containing protein [Verrucomicrobiales bacterium]|nr:ThuA domain-containing protein [Verrucomicrobiales bacterium]
MHDRRLPLARVLSGALAPLLLGLALLGAHSICPAQAAAPKVVLLIGEDEYHTWETLPEFAARDLQPLGWEVRVIQQDPAQKHQFPGIIEALADADLLLVSVRRRALPEDQLRSIMMYVQAGRPLVGIRTASHAFAPREEDQTLGSSWPAFDPQILGGRYAGHHGNGPSVTLRADPAHADHPILNGVDPASFRSTGSLYRVSPLMPQTTPLLLGSIPGKPEEPVAWMRQFGPHRARVFYTSLGHPDDFQAPAFRRLLRNGMAWAMNREKETALPLPAARPAATSPTPTNASPAAASDWTLLAVPGTWEDRAPDRFARHDGFAWYRCLVRPPIEWANREWELWVDQVDNAHEAYLEGTRLGAAGAFPPQYADATTAKSRYAIPAEQKRPGQWMLVAVRVFDHDGRGGFKGKAPALRAGDEVIALSGNWEFRTGDDPSFATRQAGEQLANSLFNEVISLEKYERGGVPEKVTAAAKPLPPEESARRFTVAEGLALDLVLSEPVIAQPLHLSFDERGRLWVVEYRQYPAPAGLKLVSHDQFWRAVYDRVPPPPPHHFRGADRVSFHEDTDGDGRYDRHGVFVDGLNIATSAARGRGGVWILNPPYLLFYPDRNDDDVPDGDPEVHLEGFGLEDTHSVANSLRWGPDGWLYGAQGSTVSGKIRRPGSSQPPVVTLGQNLWRYHPETHVYEVFSEGGGNAFGVEFDDHARAFSGHNGGNTRGFHYVPGAYLQKGFEKHGQLSNPYAFGYFPQMAHPDVERFTHTFLVYGGGALSGQFAGRLFGIEPLQGRVVMSDLTRQGSTFRTRDLGYAVTSADPWFKPVDIKHGPDGAIYVADWYDFQVNHWRNYQGNMDASNGRVYRLRADTKPTASAPPGNLNSLPTPELVARLVSPNRWVRDTVLRLLADRRDASVIPALREHLRQAEGVTALNDLWALQACGGLDPASTLLALRHPTPAVREWAVRLAGDARSVPDAVATALAQLAPGEADLEVRQQLAASARRLPAIQGLPVLRALLHRSEDASDPRQPLMLWWTLETFLTTDPARSLALFDDPGLWSLPLVSEHLLERTLRRLATPGTPADLEACARLLEIAPHDAARARLVAGFELAFRDRSLGGLPPRLVAALGRAGGGSLPLQLRTGRPDALAAALTIVTNEAAEVPPRAQVIQTLGELREPRALAPLLVATRSERDPIRVAAFGALRAFDGPDIAAAALPAATHRHPATRTAALTLLASRPRWSMALVQAVDRGELKPADVPQDILRLLRQQRGQDPALTQALARLWPHSGRPSTEAMETTIRRVSQTLRAGSGDPYNGKKLFTAACASCHTLFHVGGSIGPDLTPFRRDDLDTLLLSVVNPSAEIREGYENIGIETRDERSLSGFVVRQDDRVVVLRGLDGQDVVLQRSEIAELRAAGMSLMPEGLLDALEDQQLRDLFAYLRSSQPLAN